VVLQCWKGCIVRILMELLRSLGFCAVWEFCKDVSISRVVFHRHLSTKSCRPSCSFHSSIYVVVETSI
jgi:hypothetical protein